METLGKVSTPVAFLPFLCLKGAWLCMLVMLGCGTVTPKPAPTASPPGQGDNDSRWDFDDTADECSEFFPQACFADDDGCPDPPTAVVQFPVESSAPKGNSSALLEEIADEIGRLAGTTTLLIVGYATVDESESLARKRAETVRLWFQQVGISHRMRIEVRLGQPRVELLAENCEGQV